MKPEQEITQLLDRLSGGDRSAIDDLLPLVYDNLKAMAHGRLRGERGDHTLNTTALVHEAYLKLVDQTRVSWQDRAHFYGVASQAMRRILIDYARTRLAAKRGGGEANVTLNEELDGHPSQAEDLIALDEALTILKTVDARQSQVVEFRFFGSLNFKEIGEVLGISEVTARRDWRMARAWLNRQLGGDPGRSATG